MGLARVMSCAVVGLEGFLVEVEVDPEVATKAKLAIDRMLAIKG